MISQSWLESSAFTISVPPVVECFGGNGWRESETVLLLLVSTFYALTWTLYSTNACLP